MMSFNTRPESRCGHRPLRTCRFNIRPESRCGHRPLRTCRFKTVYYNLVEMVYPYISASLYVYLRSLL